MKHSDFLSHNLTRNEKMYGYVWLCFEAVFFSPLLQLLNGLLPAPLPQAEVNAVFFGVNFAVVALLFRRYLWKQLKLIPSVAGKSAAIALVGFAAYYLVNFLLAQAFLALDPSFASVNDMAIRELVAQDYFLMFAGTVFLVPIAEETLFRGLVFRGLYDRNPILAWALSVTLFSLIHISGYIGTYPMSTLLLCFLQYIPAGLCLAGAYRLSGSLLAPILIHALVNFVGMVALR